MAVDRYRPRMTEILVSSLGSDLYRVEVNEDDTHTIHDVTVSPGDLMAFAQGRGAHVLLEESFRFLLEREPKESILRSFDLTVISRYFPEYEREIKKIS